MTATKLVKHGEPIRIRAGDFSPHFWSKFAGTIWDDIRPAPEPGVYLQLVTFESSEARMGERAPTDFIFQPYRELEADAGERDWRELYNYVGNPLRPG